MKWGIIALVVFGLLAAACAALLMGALRVSSPAAAETSSPGIEVMTAKTSLPAMTVITLDHVVKEKVSKDDLPVGQQLSSPARIIGRVLNVPVVEGQVLTESCFVTAGNGSLLAAALPHGMRAVSVSLSGRTVLDPLLLFPGCVVDVVVSFRLPRSAKGEAIAVTMFRGLQVLAVAGESVVSNPNEADSKAKGRSSSRTVTLMVDSKQAEALQLVADHGTISLAVRNPLDKKEFDTEGTILNQGTLATLGSVLPPAVFAAIQMEREQAQEIISSDPNTAVLRLGLQQPILPQPGLQQPMLRQPISGAQYRTPQAERRVITVHRGPKIEVEELATPAETEDAAGADTKK
jgi:pilus assembly protein CpaB